jgi:hypothetical protein
MDAQGKLGDQLALAREIVATVDRHADAHSGRLPAGETDRVVEPADRLAKLVVALHDWRARGRFDPPGAHGR